MVILGVGFSVFFIISMKERYLVSECRRKVKYLKTLELAKAEHELSKMKNETTPHMGEDFEDD